MEQLQTERNARGSTNTRASKCLKRRNYMVTFWTHDYPKQLPDKAIYMCTCEDTTKDGKYHGHAYIYYKNPVAMSRIKKLFGNDCHCEKPRKSSECKDYVLRAEGTRKHDFQEFGECPLDVGMSATVRELKQIETPDDLPWMMHNTWKKIHETVEPIKITDWYKPEVKVTYIWGPSGTEKTRRVFEDIIDKYGMEAKIDEVKHVDNFWHGVSNKTDIAIYDDFRDSHMKASEFINFIDYYRHILNVKGGSMRNNYKHIYITSVQDPYEIYRNMSGDEPMKQWIRRMEIIRSDL